MIPVAIIGGGAVGTTLALALHQLGVPAVMFAGAAVPRGPVGALRPIAVSAGSLRVLEAVGVWRHVTEAAPIRCVHVSQAGHFGFTRMRAAELGVEALGHVVDAGHLGDAMRSVQGNLPTDSVRALDVVRLEADAVGVTLHLGDGGSQRATLAVLAEGGALTASAGLAPLTTQFGQTALSATLEVSKPGQGVAFERFLRGGPLALLPWTGRRYALVWTLPDSGAEAVRMLDDVAFERAVGDAFGRRLGRFARVAGRSAFPLALRYVSRGAGPRVVAVGNAAQTLHPVAGQGLNLGLRDAAALAERLAGAHATGTDLGDAGLLDAFVRARASDRAAVRRFTTGLVSVFGLGVPGFGHVRGAGLALLGAAGPLRRTLAARAAGLSDRRYRLAPAVHAQVEG